MGTAMPDRRADPGRPDGQWSMHVIAMLSCATAALTTASAEMKWRNGFAVDPTFEGEFFNVTRSYAGKGIVRYVW